MIRRGPGLPLAIRVGAVVALFVAALATLWRAGSSVVDRERRRVEANDRLKEAGDALDVAGKEALARVRPFFEFMEPEEWDEVDRRLTEGAARVSARFPGLACGYYIPDRRDRPFIPPLPEGGPGATASATESGPPGARARHLHDDIDTQADAAYRKRYDLLVVEDVPPDAVAIRATPLALGGRVVASSWAMIRLVDPIFLDRADSAYRLFARLALGGIGLSLALTLDLVRTIRRGAAERDRLQLDLRRSERLAALGKLLAGVAHEVRNPLAGIRSTAQLWRRGVGLGAESLDGLVHEVDRLEGIVSRLLQFSRADAQDLAPGDLNALVAEAARLAAGPAEAAGVRVEVTLAPSLPGVAMAPPALIQVFRNLTTNAVQAMPGGGTLSLSTRPDPARSAVVAAVADTGPGLDPEAIRHLFEPFFTTKPEGTGLGLAIAREIALAHRGELRAEARPDGPGAVFTLTLPVAPDPTGRGDR